MMVSRESALQIINLALKYLSKASHKLNVEDVRTAVQEVFLEEEFPVIAPYDGLQTD